MWYYAITVCIYFLIVLMYLKYKLRTNKNDNKKYKKEFKNYVSNMDRKYDFKKLPLKDKLRFYFLTIGMVVILFLVPIFLIMILKNKYIDLIKTFNYIAYEEINVYSFISFFSGMMCSIILVVIFMHIFNKDNFIESITREPVASKDQDYLIASIILLIFFPILVLSFNTYRIINMDSFYIKNMFSIKEKKYNYNEITYVKKKMYSDGAYDLIANINNKNVVMSEETYNGEKILELLKKYNIEIKTY